MWTSFFFLCTDPITPLQSCSQFLDLCCLSFPSSLVGQIVDRTVFKIEVTIPLITPPPLLKTFHPYSGVRPSPLFFPPPAPLPQCLHCDRARDTSHHRFAFHPAPLVLFTPPFATVHHFSHDPHMEGESWPPGPFLP